MRVQVRQGITLVGTAHVSQRSIADVEAAIRETQPDRVLVELDQARMEALRDPEKWKQTDILQVIRDKKQYLFLLQLYLASMQARMGRETGAQPGAEMLRAMEVADEMGAEVVLIDRDISITMRRGFGAMGFWARARLWWNILSEVLTPSEEGPEDVDALLEADAITQMTEEFARFAPVVKTALIDERDEYMAGHIDEQAAGGSVVAVVGAGHLPGIQRHLETMGSRQAPADGAASDHAQVSTRRDALNELPPWRLTVGKIIGVAIPGIVIGALAGLAYRGDFEALRANLVYWILVNGILSGLGALLARGHIFSALTAFVAAPLTSLSPALAAGWFAGLAEAKVHTPKVADFEAIKHIESMKGFYRNDVVRVLLVTAFANLGSVVGSWLGLAEILQSVGS